MIAEDDLLVADMLERTLTQGGYAVCGSARSVAEAVALGERHRPDLAIIDVRLADGGVGTEIVTRLRGSLPKLGVLYATGNIEQVLLTSPDGSACLGKPYTAGEMLRALEVVAQLVGTGSAAAPFPARFQLLKPPCSIAKPSGGMSDG